jgi:hypothetical protein
MSFSSLLPFKIRTRFLIVAVICALFVISISGDSSVLEECLKSADNSSVAALNEQISSCKAVKLLILISHLTLLLFKASHNGLLSNACIKSVKDVFYAEIQNGFECIQNSQIKIPSSKNSITVE